MKKILTGTDMQNLVQMIESHYQNSLLMMKIDGCASLVCLHEHAPQNLKLVAPNDVIQLLMSKLSQI